MKFCPRDVLDLGKPYSNILLVVDKWIDPMAAHRLHLDTDQQVSICLVRQIDQEAILSEELAASLDCPPKKGGKLGKVTAPPFLWLRVKSHPGSFSFG